MGDAAMNEPQRRIGIKNADLLERRNLVTPPAAGHFQLADELAADAKRQFVPALDERRRIVAEQTETVRRDRGDVRVALGDGEPAVQTAAKGEVACTNGKIRNTVDRGDAGDAAEDLQDRKIDAHVAGEEARPSPSRQNDARTADLAALGDTAAHPARRSLDGTDCTVGEDMRALGGRAARDCWSCDKRFGLAVARRMQGGTERLRSPWNERLQRLAPYQAGIEVEQRGVFQPLFIHCNVGIRVAEIGDAGLPKAGFAADTLVHAAPEPKTFD